AWQNRDLLITGTDIATGARISERFGLIWQQVNLNNGRSRHANREPRQSLVRVARRTCKSR
ncbi:MAG: hypothetical protein ACR2IV_02010, partial [Bryobacteraceae bacterium]